MQSQHGDATISKVASSLRKVKEDVGSGRKERSMWASLGSMILSEDKKGTMYERSLVSQKNFEQVTLS